MKYLYIDIDTMSKDHMGCYGYKRNTTPNIDKIAENALLFDNMYVSDAPCLPSRTSLITGQFGINTGVVNHGGKYADLRSLNEGRGFQHPLNEDGLFALFKRSGIRTTLISSFADRHSAFWFNAGFNEIYNYGDSAEQQGDEIYNLTEQWLENNKGKDDWLLYVNFWDPHTPYRVREDFETTVNKDDNLWITPEILEKHKKLIGPCTARNIDMFSDEDHINEDYFRAIGKIESYEDLYTIMNGYDIGINYADHFVGKIINILKEHNIYDDVTIVITADHGEDLGELGKYCEHGVADKPVCNIPFIVKVANEDYQGEHCDSLQYSHDIVPTVAQHLGIKPINEFTNWHGQSFLDAFRNASYTSTRDYLVISQMAHVCQRSVVFDKYLLMLTFHDGYHTYFKPRMLFDLQKDPHEQRDIAEDNPEIVNQGLAYYNEWLNERMMDMPSYYNDDPMYTIINEGGPFHAREEVIEFVRKLEVEGKNKDAQIIKNNHSRYFKGEV